MKYLPKIIIVASIGQLFAFSHVHNATAQMLYKPAVLPVRAAVHPTQQSVPSVLGINDLDIRSGFVLKLHKPEKIDYSASETIKITIDNPKRETLDSQVLDAYGKQIVIAVEQVDNVQTTDFLIRPENHLLPGKYVLEVMDQEGNVYDQSFTRGLVSLNLDQSVYQTHDKVRISLGVLGNYAEKVCTASLTLRIISPAGKIKTLSTAAGSVTTNPDCTATQLTSDPDYAATYETGEIGTYIVEVDIKSGEEDGSYQTTFRVEDRPDFIVSRNSSLYFDPQAQNPMRIRITANKDFKGKIIESVPESFKVQPDYSLSQYDETKSVLLAADKETTLLQEKILSKGESPLEMPFNGGFSISQGFGQEVTDAPLMDFYNKLGLIGHDGIDFALSIGTPLFSVDDGKVITAGTNEYGTTVVIQHSWGRSYYGHLSKTTVKVGYPVSKGSQIGYSGNSGESTGPHLHFGIRPNEFNVHNGYAGRVDPLPFLPIFTGVSNVLAASDPPILTHDLIVPSDHDASDSAIETSSSSAQELKTSQKAEEFTTLPEHFERVKQIVWNVNLRAGESKEIGYMYAAPLLEIHLYLLGPLQFVSDDMSEALYSEDRDWETVSTVTEKEIVKPVLKEKKLPVILPQKKGES